MTPETTKPQRLVSLDAFRGFTIAAMLFVNNKGGDPAAFSPQFDHAPWGQLITFTDLIFPWFLFMVGVSLPLSAASFRKKNPHRWMWFWKAFKRMLILILFGCLISCSLYKTLAIGTGGVLQLIGLAFFAGVLLYELPVRIRYLTAGLMLVIYWVLLRFISFPGPDGQYLSILTEDVNYTAYLRSLLPAKLSGLPSVIPTAPLIILGTLAGELFLNKTLESMKRLKMLFLMGAGLMVCGVLWHFDLMMSKALWTPSYILFSAGTGCWMLAAFYYLTDMKGWKKMAFPFVVFGMNAITAYFFSIIVRIHTVQEWSISNALGEKVTLWQIWQDSFVFLGGPIAGSWGFILSYLLVWWIVLYWMYRKNIFLKV